MRRAAVVDASVALKWVLDEDRSDQAAILAQWTLFAPDFLLLECANVLWRKVRLGELDRAEAAERIAMLAAAPVEKTSIVTLAPGALDLAVEFDIPVDDCAYLALARSRGVPVVTDDRRLAAAVRRRQPEEALLLLLTEIG